MNNADTLLVMETMRRVQHEIEGMAESSVVGERSGYTPARTRYVIFAGGERCEEGAPVPRFTGTIDELAHATISAVKAYRDAVGGRATLTWRQPPLYEGEAYEAGRHHSIYLRLAFEPVLGEVEPQMTEDVIPFPGTKNSIVGNGRVLDVDTILEKNKGEFREVVIIGRSADGEVHVAASHDAFRALWLLKRGEYLLLHDTGWEQTP